MKLLDINPFYCPECDGITEIDFYLTKNRNDPKRKRECQGCGMIFVTVEDNGSEVILEVIKEPGLDGLRRSLVEEMRTDFKLVGHMMGATWRLAERIKEKKQPKPVRIALPVAPTVKAIPKPRPKPEPVRPAIAATERIRADSINLQKLAADVQRKRKAERLNRKQLIRQLGIGLSSLVRLEKQEADCFYYHIIEPILRYLGKSIEDYRLR